MSIEVDSTSPIAANVSHSVLWCSTSSRTSLRNAQTQANSCDHQCECAGEFRKLWNALNGFLCFSTIFGDVSLLLRVDVKVK